MVNRAKTGLRYGLGIILWPVKIMLVLTIALFVRLAVGPVDVPVPQSAVEALMARAAPGWQLKTSGAEFDLFGKEGLTGLKLRDVRLIDGAGNEAATVPMLGLSMTLSPTDDLEEAVAVHGVRLSGATIDVLRRKDGTFSLGMGGLPALPEIEGGGTGDLTSLPKLQIQDATLRYRDEVRDIDLTARSSKMMLDPAGEAVFDAMVTLADHAPLMLAVDATRSTDGAVILDVAFDDLDPASLVALDPLLAPLTDINMILNGTVRANVAADTTVENLSAKLHAPHGGAVTIEGQRRKIERLAGTISYVRGLVTAQISDIAIADAGLIFEGIAKIRQESAKRWTIEALVPALAYTDESTGQSLRTEAVSADVRVSEGNIRFEALKIEAPILTLPGKKRHLYLGDINASGNYGIVSGFLELDRLEAHKLVVDLSDTPVRAKSLSGMATIDTKRRIVTLSPVTMTDLSTEVEGQPITLADARMAARIDIDTPAITIKTIEARNLSALLSDGNSVTVDSVQSAGSARGQTNGAIIRVLLDNLSASGVRLILPQFYDVPLNIETMSLASSITHEGQGLSIAIPRLDATVDGLPMTAEANIAFRPEGIRAKAASAIAVTDFARIPALWPKGVAPGGYKWVSKNVHTGTVTGLSLNAEVDTANPAADALLLTFDFENGLVSAVPDLPPIRNGRGRGQVSLDRLDVFLDHGQVLVPGSTGYELTDSRFSIIDFKPRIPDGHIKLNVDGPVQAILHFLDHQPLALISKSGFDISTANGDVSGKVQVKLPLAADLLVDDVDFRANAEVREFSLFEPHTGVPITGDKMAIAVTPDGLKFRSDARIDGLAARLNYAQGFAKPAPGEPEGALTLQSYLTREDFAQRAGVDISDHFDGVAVVDAKIDLFPGGGARFAADADLTGSSLHIGALGWNKSDGVPVTVKLNGFRNPNGAGQVETITLRGTGMAADGRVSYDKNRAVRLVEFDRFALAETLDTSLRYSNGIGEAGKRIELSGEYLDLRAPFKKAIDASGETEALPPSGQGEIIEIVTNIANVRLRDDLAISGLRGGIKLQGKRIDAAKIEGRVNGTGPAQILAERREDGLALRLTSSDAGAFLDAASVFEGATGGQLRLDARTKDATLPSRVAGKALITGITVRNSETMREILSNGAIGSLVQQMLSGGLTFTKVELPFSGIGGRWSIAEGVVYGNALGLTLDGTYDIDQELVDLSGTVSPAYAINGALGAVPLLGGLLTGGEGEGVFGVTFAVRGKTDDPNVWVNPLSAIAPGFLRKIVSGVMDGRNAAVTSTNTAPQKFFEQDR